MNSSSSSSNEEHGFIAGGLTYAAVCVIGSVVLLLTVAFACVRLHMARGPNMLNSRSTRDEDSAEQGLGLRHHHIDTSFESYPKLVHSQVEKGSSSSNICSSTCSICLEDYQEGDMLRLLPHCHHNFHLPCVDPWLRLHSTCPICRKSSLQPASN